MKFYGVTRFHSNKLESKYCGSNSELKLVLLFDNCMKNIRATIRKCFNWYQIDTEFWNTPKARRLKALKVSPPSEILLWNQLVKVNILVEISEVNVSLKSRLIKYHLIYDRFFCGSLNTTLATRSPSHALPRTLRYWNNSKRQLQIAAHSTAIMINDDDRNFQPTNLAYL